MKVLVIGQGGREHAMVRALSQSSEVTQVFAMPGSDGIARSAICLEDLTKDINALLKEIKKNTIDLVVVGPEVPLVDGLSSQLRKNDVLVFGPNQEPAQLEGSKIFAKDFLIEFGIPTADSVIVQSVKDVEQNLVKFKPPYVLKADGLAAGKGVFITTDRVEVLKSAQDIFERKTLGSAGTKALLEQSIMGFELSAFVLVTDSGHQTMPFFRDHKRLLDGDKGPNTGGMGVIGPISVDSDLLEKIDKLVIEPTVAGIRSKGWTYRGLLYIGLMIVENNPYVLEFNVRFGDPEAQCIFPLLEGDWASVFMNTARGQTSQLHWKKLNSCCVVVAAPGYPDSPKKGEKILGDLNRDSNSSYILHAGTKKQESYWVSNGGRVLNSVALGLTQKEAIEKAYLAVNEIHWPTKIYRRDIGATSK